MLWKDYVLKITNTRTISEKTSEKTDGFYSVISAMAHNRPRTRQDDDDFE
jgi:hypothetical protein